MSKNLFDYATKELSQDAYLMWLIDSYNSDNNIERRVSRKFINFLTNIPEDEEILELWVKPQWYKIDITVYIKTLNKEYLLFIEDKTSSYEHDQLKNYNSAIETIKKSYTNGIEIIKIFYKNSEVLEDERKRIENSAWHEISYDSIDNFWAQYTSVDHIIINQYANHVTSQYRCSKNVDLPTDNNPLAWMGFFKNKVFPRIEEKVDCWTSDTRYNYSYLGIRPKNCGDIHMPYLEIRSRDCLNNNFIAKILMYGVDFKNNENGTNRIREEISKREDDSTFKGNYGAKHDKQVAHTKKGLLKFTNEDEFINDLEQSINDYLDIVSFWNI